MIAQEVEDSMRHCGISNKDWAGLVIEHNYFDKEGNEIIEEDDKQNAAETRESYYLRYDEFIPILIAQVQKQQAEIDSLKKALGGS